MGGMGVSSMGNVTQSLNEWDPESGDAPSDINFGLGNNSWAAEGTDQYNTNMGIANLTKGIIGAGWAVGAGSMAGGAMGSTGATSGMTGGFDWTKLAKGGMNMLQQQNQQPQAQPMQQNNMQDYWRQYGMNNQQMSQRNYY